MALESIWELTQLIIYNLLNSVVNQIIERFQLVMKSAFAREYNSIQFIGNWAYTWCRC